MTEHETDLIREYVQLKYLVDVAKVTLNEHTGLLKQIAKLSGSIVWHRYKAVERELRALKVHVWVDDDGGEIIYVGTSVNMVKGRYGIKRSILWEDMRKRADIIADGLQERPHKEYKVEPPKGDPYARTNNNPPN